MTKQWTKQKNATLKDLYSNSVSDEALAKIFETTVYAVAKQRSVLGLVKNKRNNLGRKPKTIKESTHPEAIAFYKEKEVVHVMHGNKDSIVKRAKTIMRMKNISQITMYKQDLIITRKDL